MTVILLYLRAVKVGFVLLKPLFQKTRPAYRERLQQFKLFLHLLDKSIVFPVIILNRQVQETLIELKYQRLLVGVPYRDGTVLRRICRRGNKPLLLLVPYQPLRIEPCGFSHYRVNALTHKVQITGERIMIVDVEHEPSDCRR